MAHAADEFVRSRKFAERLKQAKGDWIGRKIVDIVWEDYHDDEIAAMLVLDNGETIRGPVLGEYSDEHGFD
jgi:hypothetical protein